jgi:RNA polymerase sigma-B factor
VAGSEDEDWSHGDALGDLDPGYELVELSEALSGTLAALPPRERLVLRLRFERDLTQAEIAAAVGISQMHVSRLLRRSLNRLSAAGARA